MKKLAHGLSAIAMAAAGLAALPGCNQTSASPPSPTPSATAQQNGGTSGSGSSANSSSAGGGLAGILSGGSGDTPQTIRSAQATQLNQEISRYEQQLELAESDRDQILTGVLPGVQEKAIPLATTPTLDGSLVTAGGDFVTGGVLAGVASGQGSNSASALSGSGAGSAVTSGFTALGNGISATQQTKVIQSDTAQISASVQATVASLDSEIKDLQTTISNLEAQVDALVAQGD